MISHKEILRREVYHCTYQIEITIRLKIYLHLPTTKTDINPIPHPHYLSTHRNSVY